MANATRKQVSVASILNPSMVPDKRVERTGDIDSAPSGSITGEMLQSAVDTVADALILPRKATASSLASLWTSGAAALATIVAAANQVGRAPSATLIIDGVSRTTNARDILLSLEQTGPSRNDIARGSKSRRAAK